MFIAGDRVRVTSYGGFDEGPYTGQLGTVVGQWQMFYDVELDSEKAVKREPLMALLEELEPVED